MVEFLSIKFLTERKFKDAEEKEITRLYGLEIPYGAPYEEIRNVITEFAQRLDALETEGKKREAEEKAISEEVIPEIVS
jgi:hypothetical protein